MSMHSDPATYHGRLSDGRTAATMPVQVRCAEAGLELVPVGPSGPTGTPLTWPYDTLRSGVPLRTLYGQTEHNAICRGWADRFWDRDPILRMASAMGIVEYDPCP